MSTSPDRTCCEPATATPAVTHGFSALDPMRLGLAVAATSMVLFLGCTLVLFLLPHDRAVELFNSLLHGVNIEPILRPTPGLVPTLLSGTAIFILSWFSGFLAGWFYNLTLCGRAKCGGS